MMEHRKALQAGGRGKNLRSWMKRQGEVYLAMILGQQQGSRTRRPGRFPVEEQLGGLDYLARAERGSLSLQCPSIHSLAWVDSGQDEGQLLPEPVVAHLKRVW
ncbi:hypothetical protein EWB00_000824, partial [Schistosoma japonicum]